MVTVSNMHLIVLLNISVLVYLFYGLSVYLLGDSVGVLVGRSTRD